MPKLSDEFKEILISQYRDEIEEILVESESVYRSSINYEMLDEKVQELLKSSRVDGLEDKVIWDLLQARIPSYVNYVNFKRSSRAA